MPALRDIFRARVARRIVWLFVLGAVIPVVVMGGMSFRAVNGQLEDHSRERLGQLAKNAGQSILQQLLLTQNAVRVARSSVASETTGVSGSLAVPPAVSGLAIATADGELRTLAGAVSPPPELSSAQVERLARDEVALTVSASEPRVIRLAAAVDPADSSAGTLWAELYGDSIWGAAETFVTLPTVADFCVLAGPDQPLYCTSGTARVPAAYFALGDLDARTFAIEEAGEGEGLIVGQWSFYPQQAFEVPPWRVMVAETSEAVYAPLGVFASTFPLALVLAVLLVILLSNAQIRRTLEPLQALQTGTHRIAEGDLQTRVEVNTDDEFGALAGSFNTMASQLGAQFTQFEAIQAVGQAALNGFDRDEVVVTALSELPSVSGCRSAAILLAPPGTQGAGEIVWLTDARSLGGTSFALGEDDKAWLRANPHHRTAGGASEVAPLLFKTARKGLGSGRLIAFPHLVKGEVHGATLVEMPESSAPMPEATARRVRQIANQLAVALDDVRLVKELEETSWGALVALARAIDAKSQWTAGHSERVTGMALALAREMGFGKADLDILHRGGLLHDVGKIGVPNAILDKHGKLSEDEMESIRQHPSIGARILAPIAAFAPAMPIVLHHHERWDGNGYPDGIAGEEIHPLTRVLTVADAFDAMASARPYRAGRPEAVVVEALIADSGTQFDPAVIHALMRLMADRGTLYPGEVDLVCA